jgi:very-short-patch-repair endonuclease
MTKDYFLNIAKCKFKNRFSYDLVEYVGFYEKIKIICNEHDFIFEQTPSLHITSNHCCPLCVKEYKSINSPLRKNKIDFIKRSKEIHGDKYDYSKVDYVNNKTPVIIIHQGIEYKQRPDSHISGRCPEVNKKIRLKNNQFIENAINVHGNRYNYSKVNYETTIKEVNIICKEHGIFKQKPINHLRGNGCKFCKESRGEYLIRFYLELNGINYESQKSFEDCKNINKLLFDFYLQDYNVCIEFDGSQHHKVNDFFGGLKSFEKLKLNDKIKDDYCFENNITLIRLSDYKKIENEINSIIMKYKKITTEEKTLNFIKKSIDIWGYKYDYSKTKYIDSKTPVIIVYKGVEYKQTPIKHLQKRLCELSDNRLSKDEFLRRCVDKWGNRFDYSNTKYINSYSNIEFYDRYYGIIASQKPTSHMNGNLYKFSKENFIEVSNINFNNKYDYSNVNFKGMSNKVKIVCPVHGEFEARPYDHINNRYGGSCNKCDDYKFMKEVSSFLDRKDISYNKFHRFDDLLLPFDFYIPTMRTAIEFDGIQHFQPVDHFGGVEAYERLKINDKIKEDYCEENYINLIRIRYDQIDDIYQILWENLKIFIKK